MSGYLTRDLIWGITFFVDHETDYTYGHLMHSLDLDKTSGAKKAFGKLVGRSDNILKRYHADNRRYADCGFIVSLNANNQTITFYGIRAHHHNGIVEKRIRTVNKIAQTIILHAQC